MLTVTIRPIHLAILGAFAAGILIAVVGVLALGGGDGSEPTQQEVSVANIDEAPTAAAPTQTPAPTQTAAPTVAVTAAPQPTAAPTQGSAAAPAAAAPASSGPTAAEALYRDRAAANLTVIASKFQSYYDTPSYGALNDFYQFGVLLRQFAQELDRLPPAPPRFLQVHNQLKAAMVALADQIILVEQQVTLTQFNAWAKRIDELAKAADDALKDYSLVVGVNLPPILQ